MDSIKLYQKKFSLTDVKGMRALTGLLKDLHVDPFIIPAQSAGDPVIVQFQASPEKLEKIRQEMITRNGQPKNENTGSGSFVYETGFKLPPEYYDFHKARSEVFSVRGAGSLELNLNCSVGIVQSKDNKTSIEVDADPIDLKDFLIYQTGDIIVVSHYREGTDNEVSIGNCQAFNYKTHSSRGSTKNPRVLIRTPAHGNLNANLSGSALLVSTIFHKASSLKLSIAASALTGAHSHNVYTSAASNLTTINQGGEFVVESSGSSTVIGRGSYEKVSASVSGSAYITTGGNVLGNYIAHASGLGKIVHEGSVQGRVFPYASRMASIDIG